MKIGISLLSSDKTLLGFQIRKSIEPMLSEKSLAFQPIVIITLGFIFAYIDIIFDSGKSISEEEIVNDFGFEKFTSKIEENEE